MNQNDPSTTNEPPIDAYGQQSEQPVPPPPIDAYGQQPQQPAPPPGLHTWDYPDGTVVSRLRVSGGWIYLIPEHCSGHEHCPEHEQHKSRSPVFVPDPYEPNGPYLSALPWEPPQQTAWEPPQQTVAEEIARAADRKRTPVVLLMMVGLGYALGAIFPWPALGLPFALLLFAAVWNARNTPMPLFPGLSTRFKKWY